MHVVYIIVHMYMNEIPAVFNLTCTCTLAYQSFIVIR